MARRWTLLSLFLVLATAPARSEAPEPLVRGLDNPTGIAIGPDGRTYVTVMGKIHEKGDGAVLVLDNGKATPFATGLDDPRGLVAFREWLFVIDGGKVWRVNRQGKAEVFAPAQGQPPFALNLSAITVDQESGILYVLDGADRRHGEGFGLYRISPQGKADCLREPGKVPYFGLAMDGATHLLFGLLTSELHRLNLATGKAEMLATGLGAIRGLVWDKFGRLFIGDAKDGRVLVIPRPGDKPQVMAQGIPGLADLCLAPSGNQLLVLDGQAGTVTALPIAIPGQPLDESPLPLQTAIAYPDLQWAGWEGVTAKGLPNPLRPLVLTHAGDGSHRTFVATQHGVIHVFPNDQKVTKTKVFLDVSDRVVYNDNQNEEGFLGLAFHPNYKTNGEFFAFYTTKKARQTNVLVRYRVSKDDPDRADPASEEELLRIQRPFWNHDGGTICFGPDGFLYLVLGDGGAANDPFENGQNLKTLLGKVLRLDVDHKDEGKAYAVPKDNPFVKQEGARPEIWAYGLRNVWRMAFDRPTGQLWAADVGQNLYEEINLLKAGGNYGWNRREGLHPFGAKGSGPRPEFVEPIWEYHHDVGKSITGGLVYRGKQFPELVGSYVYGDYVSAKIWALRYDEAAKRVVANRPIKAPGVPIMSFGEDEDGEVYFMTFTPTGKGIYRFVR